jgi:hypothetical protein
MNLSAVCARSREASHAVVWKMQQRVQISASHIAAFSTHAALTAVWKKTFVPSTETSGLAGPSCFEAVVKGENQVARAFDVKLLALVWPECSS